jgi:hypothetical protein
MIKLLPMLFEMNLIINFAFSYTDKENSLEADSTFTE